MHQRNVKKLIKQDENKQVNIFWSTNNALPITAHQLLH